MDGNGAADLAVGARPEDGGGSEPGSMWIVKAKSLIASPSPSPSASPSPSNAAAGFVTSATKIADGAGGLPAGILDMGDTLGNPRPIGDLDGDGVPDIVAHSALDDDGALNSGAAYVIFLHRNGTAKRF